MNPVLKIFLNPVLNPVPEITFSEFIPRSLLLRGGGVIIRIQTLPDAYDAYEHSMVHCQFRIFSALASFKVAMTKQRCFTKIKLGSCLVAPYRFFCKLEMPPKVPAQSKQDFTISKISMHFEYACTSIHKHMIDG